MIKLEEYLVLFSSINVIKELEKVSDVIIFDYDLGCAFIRTQIDKEIILEISGVTKVLKKSEL